MHVGTDVFSTWRLGRRSDLLTQTPSQKNHVWSLSREVSRSVSFLSVTRGGAKMIWPGLSGVVFGTPRFARGLRSFAPESAAAVLDHENGGTCENGRTSHTKRKKPRPERWLVEDWNKPQPACQGNSSRNSGPCDTTQRCKATTESSQNATSLGYP